MAETNLMIEMRHNKNSTFVIKGRVVDTNTNAKANLSNATISSYLEHNGQNVKIFAPNINNTDNTLSISEDLSNLEDGDYLWRTIIKIGNEQVEEIYVLTLWGERLKCLSCN